MHTAEEKKDDSLSGKLVAFFDITEDPLTKKFKEKNQPEEEKKTEWEYTR
jgi:hypothetical protein